MTIVRIAQEADADPALIRDLLPADTDMARLTAEFQTFLVRLVLDGLRKR